MIDRGWSVGVIDLNEHALAALAEERAEATAEGRLVTSRADVSAEPEMQDAVESFAGGFGGLDGIVNNAGVGGAFGPVVDLRVEDWDATFAVLTRGVFLGIKHTARILIRQGGGGSIVNVGSAAGMVGDAGPQAYSAAKAAVVHMGRVFAAELAPHRISVNTVNPGLIETPLNPTSGSRPESMFATAQPWPEVGRPEHLAQAILFFASEETGFITGEALCIDGGLTSVGARLGTVTGTNSLGFGVVGMNHGTTGRKPEVHGEASAPPGEV
ncbi:SDR family oxidoreductase [Pseudonocardia sp. C8]|nr:SDR family oxidoreductase [Pseudonocardia sp. C8]